MKPNLKKPAGSVNMATRSQAAMGECTAYPGDYSVDVIKLGRVYSGAATPVRMSRSEDVLERRIEPRHAAHVQFVGRTAEKKGPSKTYISVDVDDFQ
jgi:hypothetical protein